MRSVLTRRQVLALCGAGLAAMDVARGGLAACAAAADTNGWQDAARMNVPRAYHTATLLDDRRVLVVGGSVPTPEISADGLASTEWYDPLADRWQRAANLAERRGYHTATLLTDGRVLVAGGMRWNGVRGNGDLTTFSATSEVYDPFRDRWTNTAPLAAPRAFHTATLLDDGRVLVAGAARTTGGGVPPR